MKKKLSFVFLIIFSICVIRSSFFEIFHIPSGSMIPTLMVGDIVWVNKLAYGFRAPFNNTLVSLFDVKPGYLWKRSSPDRGDVVVFLYPQDPSMYYIKRVIGVSGDRIKIINKTLVVNDKEIPFKKENISFDDNLSDKFKNYNLSFYRSGISKKNFLMAIDHDNYHKMNTEEVVVPEGKIFVLGDNRDYSYDSRFWGMVPVDLVLGKASYVIFSALLPLKEFGQEKLKLRWDRVGFSL